jgi:hypothetical protein
MLISTVAGNTASPVFSSQGATSPRDVQQIFAEIERRTASYYKWIAARQQSMRMGRNVSGMQRDAADHIA